MANPRLCPKSYRPIPVNPQDQTPSAFDAINRNFGAIEKAFDDLRECTAAKLTKFGGSAVTPDVPVPVPVTVEVIGGATNFELEWSQGHGQFIAGIMEYVNPATNGIYWFTPSTLARTQEDPAEWPTHIVTTRMTLHISVSTLTLGPHTLSIDIILTKNGVNLGPGFGLFGISGPSSFDTGDIAFAMSPGDSIGLMCRLNYNPGYPPSCPGPDNYMSMTAKFDAYNTSTLTTFVTVGIPGPTGPIGPTGGTGLTGPVGPIGLQGASGVTLGNGPVASYPFTYRHVGSGTARADGDMFFIMPGTADSKIQEAFTSPVYQTGPTIPIAADHVIVSATVTRNEGGTGTWYLFKNPTDTTVQADAIGSGLIDTLGRFVWASIAVSLSPGDSIGLVINDFSEGTFDALEVEILVLVIGGSPTGQQGIPGRPGEDGEDGLFVPGPPGAIGLTGPIGPAGSKGQPGIDAEDPDFPLMIPGPTGPAGPQGNAGPSGLRGTPAEPDDPELPMMIPGSQGIQGTQGIQGIQGTTGNNGVPIDPDEPDAPMMIPGTQGPAGINGATGPAGPAGISLLPDEPEYPDRIPGVPGVNGINGATGPAGPLGVPADPDEPDFPLMIQGAQGTAGLNGATGPTGPAGLSLLPDEPDYPDRIPGVQGAAGVQGQNGRPGVDGNDGEDAFTFVAPRPASASSGSNVVMTYPFVYRHAGSGTGRATGDLFFLLPATTDAVLQQSAGSPEYQAGPVVGVASAKCIVTTNVQRNNGGTGTWYLFKNPTDATVQSDAVASGSIASAFTKTVSSPITLSLSPGDNLGLVINDFAEGTFDALETQITVITTT